MDKNLTISPVLFNEEEHTYTLEGHSLQGVTPIIAWLFPDTYKDIPKHILDAAAEYGSMIHAKCELADSMGIVDDDSVRAYMELKEQKGLKTLMNEYLVSDERRIASKIDMLTTDYDICDIKCTSKVHVPHVTLQTSIYAWLFEQQNAGKVAGQLYCIWLPKPKYGQPEIIQLQRVPGTICEQIVDLYFQHANPIQARALLTAVGFNTEDAKRVNGDAPEGMQEVFDELRIVKENLEQLKQREDELKAAVFEYMKTHDEKTIATDTIQFTRKDAYSSTTVDSAKLKKEFPEVFEQVKKERQVSESLTYKIL